MTNPVDDMIAYVHGPDPKSCHVLIETLRAMVAEIERLRAALREIADMHLGEGSLLHDHVSMTNIARAALEPEKPT